MYLRFVKKKQINYFHDVSSINTVQKQSDRHRQIKNGNKHVRESNWESV